MTYADSNLLDFTAKAPVIAGAFFHFRGMQL